MSKQCEGCGADLKNDICDYCGTIHKINMPRPLTIINISGTNNDVEIKRITGHHPANIFVTGKNNDVVHFVDNDIDLRMSGMNNDVYIYNDIKIVTKSLSGINNDIHYK